MNNAETQLAQILRNDPELRQKLALISELTSVAKMISSGIKTLLSIRLPFLAHPAYHINSRKTV
ncbi:hypothetical protein IOQ59_13200 [Pontibacterium sp. N1Y112]|uniref:Uncharacterized protein n=1 Tax=Pontibacterium sinense TaxID=2781979 RepID=A0A8J7FDT6_9GAMM|nr:hypothetical protein [Pontibacterium sinense]MBE9398212.1 hypothetical protein [Pontibacterium sinense]